MVEGSEGGVFIVYFSMLKALPLATAKVVVLPRPGFEPQTPVFRPERWPSTSNVLTNLLTWPSWLNKKSALIAGSTSLARGH